MITATILPNGEARKPRVWLSIIGSLVFLFLLAFLNLGRWLDKEDPPQKAAAIAILSGRMPSRALEAAYEDALSRTHPEALADARR